VDGILRYTMSSARWAVRDYDGAIRAAQRTLEIYPDNKSVGFWVAACLVAKGEYAQGIEAIRQAQAMGKRQELTALKATAYALMGRKDEARKVLGELLALEGSEQHLNSYFVARVHAALGEREAALDWLQKTVDGGSDYLFVPDWGGLRTDWAWDGLTNETRYWHLCEQLGMGKDQWPR
jgi:tetratricopeptide (TPR) repeat protein